MHSTACGSVDRDVKKRLFSFHCQNRNAKNWIQEPLRCRSLNEDLQRGRACGFESSPFNSTFFPDHIDIRASKVLQWNLLQIAWSMQSAVLGPHLGFGDTVTSANNDHHYCMIVDDDASRWHAALQMDHRAHTIMPQGTDAVLPDTCRRLQDREE